MTDPRELLVLSPSGVADRLRLARPCPALLEALGEVRRLVEGLVARAVERGDEGDADELRMVHQLLPRLGERLGQAPVSRTVTVRWRDECDRLLGAVVSASLGAALDAVDATLGSTGESLAKLRSSELSAALGLLLEARRRLPRVQR